MGFFIREANRNNSPERESLFGEAVSGIERALDANFSATVRANLQDNLKALRSLARMNKFALESYLSQAAIISLNDEEYGRLQEKIGSLITANEEAGLEQGMDPAD